jgi:tetratricopeptide (TPR) repeat protein
VREIHDHIDRAMQLDGDNPATLTNIAFCYATLREGEAGLRLARRATELAPNYPEARAALGTCYFQTGQIAKAIDAFTRQLQLSAVDFTRAFSLGALGICLFEESRSSEAEKVIDQALALHPTNYAALRVKAIVAADLGKNETARAIVRQLREAEPGKSVEEYLGVLQRIPSAYKRKNEAIAILRGLLEATQGHP